MSEIPGLGFSTVLETDDFQHFEDTLALGGTHASEDRTPNAAAAFKTKENIFEDSVVGIDAWRFAPDTKSVDFVFAQFGDRRAAIFDTPNPAVCGP